MLITLDLADQRPIYQQIVDEVRRAVVTGSLVPGEPLPSVRVLAADLKVNPNTVQQAYRELERAGVAFTRRGQGTFVAASREASQREVLAREVAERALRDARRFGIEPAELVAAIGKLTADALPSNPHRTPA